MFRRLVDLSRPSQTQGAALLRLWTEHEDRRRALLAAAEASGKPADIAALEAASNEFTAQALDILTPEQQAAVLAAEPDVGIGEPHAPSGAVR